MTRACSFLSLAGGDGSAEDGGGAGSWLASIKEKSKEIAEVYKRDIGTCCRAGPSIVPGALLLALLFALPLTPPFASRVHVGGDEGHG